MPSEWYVIVTSNARTLMDACFQIIFETITGEMPYAGVKDPAIIYKVLERKLPSRPQAHIPTGIEQADRLWSMLTSCWAYNPSDRPKAWEVRNMTASIAPRNLLSNEG
ncbi:hypothetical protein B0J17DRAFT_402178 [Rhizoctonia solani]|nr:hypothetical protein B0J17DRAFT_402178 [Rhizoctonia solani]